MSPARPYRIPEEDPPVVLSPTEGRFLIAPHWPFDDHALNACRYVMWKRGHCLIRAVKSHGGEWYAIEGSHRIYVAWERQTPVTIQPVDKGYRLQHDNPDLGIVTAADILAVGPEIRGPQARYKIKYQPAKREVGP